MPNPQLAPVIMENRKLIFRNFSGKEGTYNAAGKRNFNVLLDLVEAEKMEADGWNVKWLAPREEGDLPQPRLEVAVSFKGRPPRMVLITSRGKTALDESMMEILDWAEFSKVDLIVRAYHWNVGEKSGIKAYLQSIYLTLVEDALELKYADVDDAPDSALSGITMNAQQEEVPF